MQETHPIIARELEEEDLRWPLSQHQFLRAVVEIVQPGGHRHGRARRQQPLLQQPPRRRSSAPLFHPKHDVAPLPIRAHICRNHSSHRQARAHRSPKDPIFSIKTAIGARSEAYLRAGCLARRRG